MATSPIELVQRQGSSFGFLIFSPVYIRNSGELIGFVSGVFDIDMLVGASMLNNQSSGIDFTLTDDSHDPTLPILSGSINDGNIIQSTTDLVIAREASAEIVLPNRVWKLTTGKSAGSFERGGWLWAVPVLGVIESVGLATSAQTIERRRQTSMLLLASEYERAEFNRRIVEQELESRAQKTRMIDSVSHELRTPLTVITARADLLSRKLPNATERQRFDISSINKSAKQLKGMIDSLIEYSFSNTELLGGKREFVDIHDIVNQVIVHFSSDVMNKRLIVKISDSLLRVRCDHILIKRALIELIKNADQYGVKEEVIELSVIQRDLTTTFSVENSGDPISLDDGISLFQPLVRGAIFGDASRPGIGLGLAFVRSIAEVHNGTVTFSRSPNGNNVFGFEISERVEQSIA
ncbi:MAG: CHASE domain-containing protein [Chloroflexi bacterium]|nr:CHASE domain-containing protein [Chloroflexota bacterium]